MGAVFGKISFLGESPKTNVTSSINNVKKPTNLNEKVNPAFSQGDPLRGQFRPRAKCLQLG